MPIINSPQGCEKGCWDNRVKPPKNKKKPAKDVPFTREQVMGIFLKHDKNNDKLLSKEELKAAFDELGSIVPQYRAWRGCRYADANGDGFISELEMNDLVEYAFDIGYKVH